MAAPEGRSSTDMCAPTPKMLKVRAMSVKSVLLLASLPWSIMFAAHLNCIEVIRHATPRHGMDAAICTCRHEWHEAEEVPADCFSYMGTTTY
ncbi:hypothetical protein ASPFODRAFT_551106 [Aspergillus luchuensis CBS 106.47]|uniref:Uncharacterized protein n=1 Tax=Aspergillus luchuensis (strain CBS 106.47) TaxID=1137211 RepID=A0A1M3TP75_ASPLC|nr:hypothetical protein ASPFODRAFT_551106 [Aspergillus luchuensis CBS 106.47]